MSRCTSHIDCTMIFQREPGCTKLLTIFDNRYISPSKLLTRYLEICTRKLTQLDSLRVELINQTLKMRKLQFNLIIKKKEITVFVAINSLINQVVLF